MGAPQLHHPSRAVRHHHLALVAAGAMASVAIHRHLRCVVRRGRTHGVGSGRDGDAMKPPIPPDLALLRPPSLDALAAGYVRQPVTATNAELALAELARNTRMPERVRAWDAARAAWAAGEVDW